MSEFVRAASLAKAEQRGALLRALAGLPAQPAADTATPEPASGFDGGARPDQPLVTPSHGETLLAIIATRAGDAGANF
jgi:hypothetical protein